MVTPVSKRWAMLKFISGAICIGLATAAWAAPAFPPGPPPTPPTITISVPGGDPWVFAPAPGLFVASEQTQSWNLMAPHAAPNILGSKADVIVQQLDFNPDPFVLNNILVTNTTTSTQIFSAFVGLPTSFGAPNMISGNVTTTIIDGGSDGATIASVVGFPIYSAQIDFVQVASLQADPFSVVAHGGGNNNAAASFGLSPSATAITSNMGIQLRFSLTAGDTASILSRFDVVVPEPAALSLCVVGVLLLPRARREK